MEREKEVNLMESDEPQSKKVYPCYDCGHSFDAAAPDDFYIYAQREPCFVCKCNHMENYVKWNYECDNCHKMNFVFWHHIDWHSEWELAIARSRKRSTPKLLRNIRPDSNEFLR